MRIAADVLVRQGRDALERWPWIGELEDMHALPRWLLLAVGSRETNLNPAYTQGATGDGGHGHGVMQYDDRSHTIPAGFDFDARLQFTTAAAMLRSLGQHFKGNWSAALAAYNAGVGAVERRLERREPVDWATTGRDYSSDVLARRDVLDRALDHQPHPPQPSPLPPTPPPPIHVIRNGRSYMQHTVIVTIDRDGNGWEPTNYNYAGAIVQNRATANPRPAPAGNGRYHIAQAAGLDTDGKLDVVVMGADPSPSDTQRYTVPILVDVPD